MSGYTSQEIEVKNDLRNRYKLVTTEELNNPTCDTMESALEEFRRRAIYTAIYHEGAYDEGHTHWMVKLATVITMMDEDRLWYIDPSLWYTISMFAELL